MFAHGSLRLAAENLGGRAGFENSNLAKVGLGKNFSRGGKIRAGLIKADEDRSFPMPPKWQIAGQAEQGVRAADPARDPQRWEWRRHGR